jgi:hypothetical protein
MTPEHADTLQALIEAGRDQWPLPQEVGVLHQLNLWAAFRESNRRTLRHLHPDWHQDRRYVVDPLPERVADAFADLIFGADPEIVTADQRSIRERREQAAEDPNADPSGVEDSPDQQLLDDAVEENNLPSELQEAAALCVGEGEVWWRIYVDRDAYEYPVVEWHSRRNVIPLYRGRKVLACAFVSELGSLAADAPQVRVGDDEDPAGTRMWVQSETSVAEDDTVFRYVEIQTTGLTRNLLYKGNRTSLGEPVALATRDETAELPDEWPHDLDVMLAGRVTNGTAGRLGRSQYAGVKDLLFALNESASIGEHNARLTLRQRMIMPATAAQPRSLGVDDEGRPAARAEVQLDDVYLVDSDDELGTGPATQPKVLEYSFDAAALSLYTGDLTDRILTRCRVAPQLVGRATEGAQTGPALRARLLDSILASNGKARAWDDAMPRMLRALQLVMVLPEEQGGHGYQMVDADTPPAFERSSTLPEDEDAMVTRLAVEVNGEFLSRRTALEERHPDWEPGRVQDEMDRIEQERSLAAPALGQSVRVTPPPAVLPNGNGLAP